MKSIALMLTGILTSSLGAQTLQFEAINHQSSIIGDAMAGASATFYHNNSIVHLASVSASAGAYVWWTDQMYDFGQSTPLDLSTSEASLFPGYYLKYTPASGSVVDRLVVRIHVLRDKGLHTFAEIAGAPVVNSESRASAFHAGSKKESKRVTPGVNVNPGTNQTYKDKYVDIPLYYIGNSSGSNQYRTLMPFVFQMASVRANAFSILAGLDVGLYDASASAYVYDDLYTDQWIIKSNPKFLYITPDSTPSGINLLRKLINVRIFSQGGSVALEDTDIEGLIDGKLFISPDVSDGSYDIVIKPEKALSERISNVSLTASSEVFKSVTFRFGDVNGDNEINDWDTDEINDRLGLTILDRAWYSMESGIVASHDCDLNDDGVINLVDLAIAQANVGQQGN